MSEPLELRLPPKQCIVYSVGAIAWGCEVDERQKQVSMVKERHRKSQDEFEEVRYYTELLQESVAQEAAWRKRAEGGEADDDG